MLSHIKEYHRSTDVAETSHLLARSDIVTVPLAGGTRLVAAGIPGAQAVADLRDLGLNTIEVAADGLHLGAMVTLQMIMDDPCPGTWAGGMLAEAARHSATRNVRNVATLGGTVATAGPLDELLLALLALDAQMSLVNLAGKRHLPLADFLANPAGHLPQGTLIAELILPALPSGLGTGLARVARTPTDQPIVAAVAALAVADGRCTHVRLALTGVASRPLRLPEIETMLTGQALRPDDLAEAGARVPALIEPLADFRASAGYRREMAGVVARRALQTAWERSGRHCEVGLSRRSNLSSGQAGDRFAKSTRSDIGKRTVKITLTINGEPKTWDVAPGDILLDVLRREGYLGAKRGCEDGSCGLCTVLLGGQAVNSCTLLVAQVDGRHITTIEGLGTREHLHPLQQAFVELGAIQCGYCTPAMILAAKALLDANPQPTEAEVRDALASVYCRCTGYAKPLEAVLQAVKRNA